MGGLFSRELFSPLRPERPPLTGNEALQALWRADQLDEYRRRVMASTTNMLARVGQTYMPVPHSTTRTVPGADPDQPWPNGQVIWMDSSADGGLPHTRAPNYICLSVSHPDAALAKTLLHERIHVSQRLHPKEWEALLKDVWDMKPWVGAIPADIEKRRRINPDLCPAPDFVWKDEYVVLGLFQSEKSPKLAEIDLVWWSIKTRTLLRDPPPGWLDFFGDIKAGEHPYEIAAYLIEGEKKGVKAYDVLKEKVGTLPTWEV